jgi:MFS family permease
MSHLWIMDMMNMMLFFSIGVVLPLWREELGVTPTQAGLLGSTGFLGFGLMALPASIWLTSYSPKVITLISALGMSVFAIGQALAPNPEWLIATRFGFVMMSAIRIQMQVVLIYQWFQPRWYAIVNSLDFGNRSIAQTLAVAATPPLIFLIGDWRALYFMVGIVLFAVTISWAFAGRTNYVPHHGKDRIHLGGNPAQVLRRHKVLWIFSGAQLGAAVTFASFITFYPTLAMDQLTLSLEGAGALMSFFPMGAIAGTLIAGPLSQVLGRRKPFIWVPGLILPICYFSVLHATSPTWAGAILFVAGFFAMAVPPILATVPFDMRLTSREVAVAQGLTRTLFPLGATIGPMIVGIVTDFTGSLMVALTVVTPMPITLFFCGILVYETGSKGQIPRT